MSDFSSQTAAPNNLNSASTDTLFAAPQAQVGDFTFDERVVAVFPDMIERSVPAYQQMVSYTGLWARRFAQANSNIYDLGCSLGATLFAMRAAVEQPGCRLIGIDNSAEMLQKLRANLSDNRDALPVDLVEADLQQVPIENASVIVLNFTLQFIDPAERDGVIQACFDGLLPGGLLLISEKVVHHAPAWNELLIDLHHDLKRANGYSSLEVAQKRQAIMDVLIPESAETHLDRLQRVGFASAEQWFQALNFASFAAIKQPAP